MKERGIRIDASFAILGATVVATEEKFSKFKRIISKKKIPKSLGISDFSEFPWWR